jgi:hypothetical protein
MVEKEAAQWGENGSRFQPGIIEIHQWMDNQEQKW